MLQVLMMPLTLPGCAEQGGFLVNSPWPSLSLHPQDMGPSLPQPSSPSETGSRVGSLCVSISLRSQVFGQKFRVQILQRGCPHCSLGTFCDAFSQRMAPAKASKIGTFTNIRSR